MSCDAAVTCPGCVSATPSALSGWVFSLRLHAAAADLSVFLTASSSRGAERSHVTSATCQPCLSTRRVSAGGGESSFLLCCSLLQFKQLAALQGFGILTD